MLKSGLDVSNLVLTNQKPLISVSTNEKLQFTCATDSTESQVMEVRSSVNSQRSPLIPTISPFGMLSLCPV